MSDEDDTDDIHNNDGKDEQKEENNEILEFTLSKRGIWGNWKECVVRIEKDTNNVYIDNSNHIQQLTKSKDKLELNQCTISFTTKMTNNNKIIEGMIINYSWNNHSGKQKSIKLEFRLQEQNEENSSKLKQFIATLIHYGSQFDKLADLLTKWDNNKHDKKLSKTEIVEIIRIKAQYDMYINTHDMNKYMDMIDNMDTKVIKPLKTFLNNKQFRETMDENEWKERCKNMLIIENKWKLILQKIKVGMENVKLKSEWYLSSNNHASSNSYNEYESIRKSLKNTINEIDDVVKLIIDEQTEWIAMNNKYDDQDSPAEKKKGKIIIAVGIFGVCVALTVFIAVFAPELLLGAFIAKKFAAKSVLFVTIGATISTISFGTIGYGMHLLLPKHGKTAKEYKKFQILWEKFSNHVNAIRGKIHYIANTPIVPDDIEEIDNFQRKQIIKKIKNIKEMCVKLIKQIDKQ